MLIGNSYACKPPVDLTCAGRLLRGIMSIMSIQVAGPPPMEGLGMLGHSSDCTSPGANKSFISGLRGLELGKMRVPEPLLRLEEPHACTADVGHRPAAGAALGAFVDQGFHADIPERGCSAAEVRQCTYGQHEQAGDLPKKQHRLLNTHRHTHTHTHTHLQTHTGAHTHTHTHARTLACVSLVCAFSTCRCLAKGG